MQSSRRFAKTLSVVSLLFFLAPHSYAIELKQQTAAAFDAYVAATEARMAEELRPGGAFLYIDTLPSDRRSSARVRLVVATPACGHRWRGCVWVRLLQTVGSVIRFHEPPALRSRPLPRRWPVAGRSW